MVTVPVQIQICVWASYKLMLKGIIRLRHNDSVQERNRPIFFGILCLNWMCRSMLLICSRKTFLLCSLYDNTGVIHISFPNPWRIFSCVDGLGLKILHVEVGHNGADGRPHSCSLQLFKIPALEMEVGGFHTKL